MYVEKMFSVPIGAGCDGFPFSATQAEKEMAEAFTVKAMAEREAFALKAKVKKPKAEESSFVVKAGCGSKRKAGEDREGDAAFTVKAKAEEEAACAVKAKAEEEAAFAVKAKAEEEAAFAVKAKAEEEAAFAVKAKAEEEAAAFTVKAKSEEEEAAFTVQAKSEEEVAAFTVQAEEEVEVEDSDDDCDSDEVADVDYEEFMARLIADYNAHADKLRADHPGMKYTDYSTEEYAYMRQSEEEEDSDADERFRAEYGDLFHKLKKEGSHGVDGLAPV